jgi:excisionase family DNA binding protein
VEEIMTRFETVVGVRSDDSPIEPSGRMTLTDVEVATRLGVSRFTLRAWRLKGHGPKFLKMGRAVRYRPEDVDEYERQALVETQVPSDHHPA